MTEVLVATFEAQSAADAAVQDLETARIPSAVVHRHVAKDPDQRLSSAWPDDGRAGGSPCVTVAVDDLHAEAVAGILEQHGDVSGGAGRLRR